MQKKEFKIELVSGFMNECWNGYSIGVGYAEIYWFSEEVKVDKFEVV